MNKPNLLFIYTDEQAFNTLKAYGNDQIDMPNLNRLADRSHVFERMYVTQPVCTPSRSSLLTGLYPHTNGCSENNVPLAQTTKCLPEMVDGDYVTAHFGKWHLGDEVFAQHGFQHWASVEDQYQKYFSEGRDKAARSSYHDYLIAQGLTPKNGDYFSRGEAARLPEELGKPAYVAKMANDFLRTHINTPFVLYVNFFEPHMPFFSPRDDQYPLECIPLPDNFDHELANDSPLKTRIMKEQFRRHGHSGMALETEDDWKRMIAHYWGLCSLVDTHIGSILDTLDACGLDDSTMIVFTSDHGDMMGAHQLLTKCFMYEEAARVPFLVKLPGQTQGKLISGAFSQIDVVPTILDYLGATGPDGLQGNSLRRWIEAESATVPDSDVFMEWSGGNNGLGDVVGEVSTRDWMLEFYKQGEIVAAMSDPVRTVYTQDGWKFNYSQLGEHELYQLTVDAGETDNIYGRTNIELVNSLVAKIRDWQHRTQDTVPVSPIDR
ncbi:sulfatase-like hydrolase/transferase [Devosia rhodophyticola]|uniref:Sulfatase-like hydrolase/transferase n=1 Tax=Devosia rhodophyticola TaxID=3026423 RepID=A0ABY7Z218_9HYPH|nr:sulfatase-like hydrolase/transferase [Devosia rhodophyticola]WDR07149.1 sulfatase-like hydrolase/transferase [Devosia rhodophyticola]